ncbi:fibronectin type III domain-containing protein [Saccharospirillum salsuginis]|uniref:Fibronectin type-III domain-containing protein n=1 Tax=Saccharospirillum salsuginis TaxID=418750 RepID=A0A918K558_9GAMM|nr:fibronectin type III domain-containing protein [Saccharospirillum salsuginis]GGX49759.1 hypothetical protein GCM10007392_16420 [Saccharospirillum salsuginis]
MSRLLKLFVVLCIAGLTACDAALTDMNRTGSVSLYWSQPLERSDGSPLELTDIKGYEVRLWQGEKTEYETIFVDGYSVTSYHIEEVKNPKDVTVRIAVVDNNGIYSDFVTAQ